MDTRILIVDDEEVMCDMVSDFLERFGHRSDTAGSVKPALKLMESRDYDIVLTDKNMPGIGQKAVAWTNPLSSAVNLTGPTNR